jgi:DNA-binding CsgD family transcriptional regulator
LNVGTDLTTHTELFSPQEWIGLKERLHLSERQAQTTQLIREGQGDKQIACKLGISVPTARSAPLTIQRLLDILRQEPSR